MSVGFLVCTGIVQCPLSQSERERTLVGLSQPCKLEEPRCPQRVWKSPAMGAMEMAMEGPSHSRQSNWLVQMPREENVVEEFGEQEDHQGRMEGE